MREIKYRQPLFYNGKFNCWFYWGFTEGKEHGFIAPQNHQSPNYQFTGLHDKEGKEIYEGDVVKVYYYSRTVGSPVDITTRIDVIIYNHTGFQLKSPRYRETWGELEVIGNKFQNPELLEATPCQ